MTTIAAIVPMRHASERVPGKNYRDFGGKPLYHQIIETLLDTSQIGSVIIDTDSPFILDDAANAFPSVVCLERPEHLRDGTISMNKILLNDMSQVTADFYLQTHSTNPLLRSATISAGVASLMTQQDKYDSLFSVTRLQTRLWDKNVKAVNHDPAVLLRTQDLPPVFEENSCLYLFTEQSLKEYGNRIGKRPLMFEIDANEAIDIDVELDFRVAELLYLERQK